MARKSLFNQLELGYAPLTAYEFAFFKKDQIVEDILTYSSLYIIAQSLFKNVNKKRVRDVNWIKNVNLELQNKKIDVSNGLNPYSVAIYKKNA